MDQNPAWRPLGWSIPRLLLVSLIGILCLVVILGATTSSASFNPYNSDWNGNTEFRQIAATNADISVVTETSTYGTVEAGAATSFVFGPEQSYTPNETAAIREFVARGGLLVVADDTGSAGNKLLSSIGASARFDGQLLRDDRNNIKTPALPLATDIGRHSTLEGVDSLALNYGTVIQPGTGTPIANSSEFSYLVNESNSTVSNATTFQSSPVVTVEQLGEGEVMLVSDPSIFVNSMLEEADNRAFATNLIQQRQTVMVDVTHSSSIPPLIGVILFFRSSPLSTAVAVSVLLTLTVLGRQWQKQDGEGMLPRLVYRLRRTLRGTSEPPANSRPQTESIYAKPEAIKSVLQARHPEWDDEQLSRVITEIIPDEMKANDDE